MQNYLETSEYINWHHPLILDKAKALKSQASNPTELAKCCFEFVRDKIKHSWDYKSGPVTCRASDVLKHRTGYCYAKSHLLAALLRANDIPTALCYQRLTIQDDRPPYCLHGLNAVYLAEFGWFRIDARGNKESVDAQFTPPLEKLAFPIITEGEADLPELWTKPLPVVTEALINSKDIYEVAASLPDIEILNPNTMSSI